MVTAGLVIGIHLTYLHSTFRKRGLYNAARKKKRFKIFEIISRKFETCFYCDLVPGCSFRGCRWWRCGCSYKRSQSPYLEKSRFINLTTMVLWWPIEFILDRLKIKNLCPSKSPSGFELVEIFFVEKPAFSSSFTNQHDWSHKNLRIYMNID